MNGGTPVGAPLRAVRHAPVLVDDVGAAARLAPLALRFTSPDLPLDAEELVRWARAYLVAVQGALHDRVAAEGVQPWNVALDPDGLPSLKGDPMGRRRDAALALLGAAGLIVGAPGGTSAVGPVRLAESAFVAHRAGLEIAWGAVCHAAGWEPASLLTARALADIVVPAQEPAPATLRELMDRTGYAAKQVRSAVRRLVDASVLVVDEAPGVPSQYRFGEVALPAAPAAVPPQPAAVPTGPTAPAGAPSPAPPERPAPDRRVALRMTLNGVTVTLGAGLAPHVELDADGVPHLSFDPPRPP